MLARGPSLGCVAAVPFLVFAAPSSDRAHRWSRAGLAGPQHFGPVMATTVFAGIWSLMSGTVSGDGASGGRKSPRLIACARQLKFVMAKSRPQ